MTSISDNSTNGNELILNGNSKVASGHQDKQVTYKSQVRPSGLNAVRAGDRFGSVLDINSNTLLVGTANHTYNEAGASSVANAGAAWLFEKQVKYISRNQKIRAHHKQVFNYTGADQSFTIPENVERITVQMIAAGGGGNTLGTHNGGDGAYVKATLLVNSGTTLNVIVGQGGTAGGTTAAYGGGGYLTQAGGQGGSGGGRSALAHPYLGDLITAGAGGGAGKDGPGGNGGIVGGAGVATRTTTHPVEAPINVTGAKGFMQGMNLASVTTNYVAYGSTYDRAAIRLNNTYLATRYNGGNASPATVVPGNVFNNGAGGAGFAGGAAGPDGYGYRSTAIAAQTYYDVGGSGSGGSSMVDPTPAMMPLATEDDMIIDVVTYDGGNHHISSEFAGIGVGGDDTTPGANGIVVIEWDELETTEETETEESWGWVQAKKLVPAGTNARVAQDLFGTSVAVSGDWAFVGAPGQSYDAAGADSKTGAGAVFVFKRTAGVWSQVQKIVATGTNGRNAGDAFGTALAFANGRLFVGAPGNSFDATGVNSVTAAGAVFIYDLNVSTWELSAKLSANGVNSRIANDNFGFKLSAYGNAIAVSSKNGYDITGTTLTTGAGAVFVYENTGSWSQTARLVGLPVASSAFGSTLSLRDNLLSIEASGNSTRYVFEKTEGSWTLNNSLSDSSVSNILMYSRMTPLGGTYSTGINGVNMSFVNRSGSAYSDNMAFLDRTFAGGVCVSFTATSGAFFRMTGVSFADRDHFTWEHSIQINNPTTYDINEGPKLPLPMVRRTGNLWGLFNEMDEAESNGGKCFFQLTRADNSKDRFDFGTIQTRTWVSLAMVRDGNELRTYVNGELRNTYDVTGIVYQDNNTNIVWGYDSSMSTVRPAAFYARDFKVRSIAAYNRSYTPSLGVDLTTLPADNARGRGTSTFVWDANTIFSALPASHSDEPIKQIRSTQHNSETLHSEEVINLSGQIEVSSKIDDTWVKASNPIVAPGHWHLRETSAQFGRSVFINKDHLIVSAPYSNYVGHAGQYQPYSPGSAYLFDVQNDLTFKRKLAQRSASSFENTNRYAGYLGSNHNGKALQVDNNYFDRHNVFFNFMYPAVNGSNVEPANTKKVFTIEMTGRSTEFTFDGPEYVSRYTKTYRQNINTTGTWGGAFTSGNWNPITTAVSYVIPSLSITGFGFVAPINYIGETPYYLNPTGVRVNPDWDSTSSGYVAPLVPNVAGTDHPLTQTFTYPGSLYQNRYSGDFFGYDVKTNGTDVFVGVYGSRAQLTSNAGYSVRGAIHRYNLSVPLSGWQLQETIFPPEARSSLAFGFSLDISGDYLITRATPSSTIYSYVYKKGANGYEFVRTFNEAQGTDPYVYNSIRFFEDDSKFIVGSPDYSIGNLTSIGYAHVYTQDVNDEYTWDSVNYRPTNIARDDRNVNAQFGVSMDMEGTRLVVGAQGYNKIDNGANIRTNMGAAFVYDKDENGEWKFTTQLINQATDAASNQMGYKVGINGDRIFSSSYNVSAFNVYSMSGATATFEQRLTATGRGAQSNTFLTDGRIVMGQSTFTPGVTVANFNSGSFTQYTRSGTTWTKGGDYMIPLHTNGAYEQGTITYTNGQNVTLSRNLNAQFGIDLAMSDDKTTLVVGSPGHFYVTNPNEQTARTNLGAAFAYYWDAATSQWRLNTKIQTNQVTASNGFYGRFINTATTDNFVISGAYNSNSNGDMNVVTKSGTNAATTWTKSYYFNSPTAVQNFGADVAWDAVRGLYYVGSSTRTEGTIASGTFETHVPGAPPTRTAFNIDGTINNRNAGDQFAFSVSVFNDAIAIGVPYYDYNTAGTSTFSNKGAVYTYKVGNDGLFEYDQKITFEAQPSTNYGAYIGLNEDTLYVQGVREIATALKRGVSGDFETTLTFTTAPNVNVTTAISDKRVAWDNVSKRAVISDTTGAFNIPGTINGYGGALQIEYNSGTDSFAVVNKGVMSQTVTNTGFVENAHVYVNTSTAFAMTGMALSPDASMLAVSAANDLFNMSDVNGYNVGGATSYGKIFVYRWNAILNKFEYHSVIISPVPGISSNSMSLSWIDGKLSVTNNPMNKIFTYQLVDDRFWRIVGNANMENSVASSILTLDGNALVMSKPTSNGYPTVASSGAVRTQILDNGVWGSSRGIHAGADAEAFSSATSAGGGGGAGAIGGKAGGSINTNFGRGGQGGTNLVPTDGTQIISNGAARANSANANAFGAGANAQGVSGEDARIVVTHGGTDVIFDYTGFDQTFTVPAGVTEISIAMWGAGGGAAAADVSALWSVRRSGRGGAGAFVGGTLAVTEGETLTIVVGGGGTGGTLYTNQTNRNQNRKYGFGGLGGQGASTIDGAGCGGGLAGIKRGDDYLAIAAGGGGGSSRTRGTSYTLDGGPGGYEIVVDNSSYIELISDSNEVVAPGIVNSRSAQDYFGFAVGIKNDNSIYIGAPGHDYDSGGDALPSNSGVVFEYKRVNGKWQLVQKIVSKTATVDQNFGFGLEVSDTNLLVLGSRPWSNITGTLDAVAQFPLANSIELFAADGDNFISQAKHTLSAAVDLGVSIAMVGDKIVLGNPRRATDSVKPSISNAGGFTTFEVATPTFNTLDSVVGDGVSHGRFAGDQFGSAVEMTPTQILIGAPGHDYGNNGANFRDGQGAIFVFDKKGSSWGFREKLNLETSSTYLSYGSSLKLIGDKLYAGVSVANHVVELTATNGAWAISKHIEAGAGKIAEIISTNRIVELDPLGSAGTNGQPTISQAGRAKTFTVDGAGLLTDANQDYTAPGGSNGRNASDQFGYSVYANHDFVVVGAPGHGYDVLGSVSSKPGALYVFNKAGTVWNKETKIVADVTAVTGFGRAISGRNGWIISSGLTGTDGFARVFQRVAEGNWQTRKDYSGTGTSNDSFGWSVAAADTSKFIVGKPTDNNSNSAPSVIDSGTVQSYERIGSDWFDRGEFSAFGNTNGRNGGDWFGYSVAANKSFVVIGSPQYAFDEVGDQEITNAGAIWIYLKNGQFPMVGKYLSPSRTAEGRFGTTVAIDERNNKIAVGEPGANKVHIFTFDGEALTLEQTLTVTLDAGEVFGTTLAMNSGLIAVGSAMASTDATGTNVLTNAGAAYVFEVDNSTGTWTLKEKITGFSDEAGAPMVNGRNAEDAFGTSVALDADGALIVGAPGHDYDREGANLIDNAGAVFIKKID